MAKFKKMLILTALTIIAGSCFSQAEPPKPKTNLKSGYPYAAEIVGKDVYIRAGAGMNYYRCSKISSPARIIVVQDSNIGWSKIKPPQGSFSWISKRYVEADPANPKIGIVSGDNVRVWAGSPYVPPIHSSSMQLKLNTGDAVKFHTLPNGKNNESDYYCIEPPKGAYLWLNSAYIRKLGSIDKFSTDPTKKTPAAKPAKPSATVTTTPAQQTTTTAAPATPFANPVKPVQPKPAEIKKPDPIQLQAMQEYLKLSDKINAELKKPLKAQNYSTIKEALNKIAQNKDAGKAFKYAEYQLKIIKSYEAAKNASTVVKSQDAQLKKTLQQIRQQREQQLSKIVTDKDYTIKGTIQTSAVYNRQALQKRYIIKNDSGKIIAYATPSPKGYSVNVEKMIGKKVGINGTLKPDPLTPITLIRYDDMVLLEK